MRRLKSFSSKETMRLGEECAESVRGGRGPIIFALEGNLGAGKTTFTQGFARGLGVHRMLPSPTFVIMRRYAIRMRGVAFKNLYHIDAYRITNENAEHALGLQNLLRDPSAIILVEWAERIRKILPRRLRRIRFLYGEKEHERSIIIP